MAGTLDFVNAAGSVAGVVGLGYQVYSGSRERAAARRSATAPSTVAPPPAAPPPPQVPQSQAPGSWAPPTGAWAPPDAGRSLPAKGSPGPRTLLIAVAALLLAALLAVSVIVVRTAADGQIGVTAVVLLINAVWAAMAARSNLRRTPPRRRAWVYGAVSVLSLGAAVWLAVAYSSMVF
jgi:hypothetical protein